MKAPLTGILMLTTSLLFFHCPSHAQSPPTTSDAAGDCATLTPRWSFTLDESNAVRLFNKQMHLMHANLVGAVPYGDDGLVVYDDIEMKLQRYDAAGNKRWAVGQEGDGPEDHRLPCEPLVLDDGRIALVSYSPQSKIIYYDDDGAYLHSRALPGYIQFHRLVLANDRVYAVTHRQSGEIAAGLTIESYVASFDEDLLPAQDKLINAAVWKTWRPGEVVDEADHWVLPRVGDAGRGRILVQPDVFQASLAVYDHELNEVGRIEPGWKPLARPQAEIDAIVTRTKGAKIPVPTLPALRHVLRVNGELWLEQPRTDGRLVFSAYDDQCEHLRDVELCGSFPEDVALNCHGDRLLAYATENAEDGTLIAQTFTMYTVER